MPRDYRHPIVRKFRDYPNSGLLDTPVGQYFKVKLLETVSNEQVPGMPSGLKPPEPVKSDSWQCAGSQAIAGRSCVWRSATAIR